MTYSIEYLNNNCNLSDLKYILISLNGTPGTKSKNEIIDTIIKIQNGEIEPSKNRRGRPRNNARPVKYDITKVATTFATNPNDLVLCDHEKAFNYGDTVEGILEITGDGNGLIRLLTSRTMSVVACVSKLIIAKYKLRVGDSIKGKLINGCQSEINEIISLNGHQLNEDERDFFEDLIPNYPSKRVVLDNVHNDAEMRMIDLFAPIGLGQRSIIAMPNKYDKPNFLKTIVNRFLQNYPNIKIVLLVVDERPEDIAYLSSNISGEIYASTFERTPLHHAKVSEIALERAKRLVEEGNDVLVLIDSITKITKSYNAIIEDTNKNSFGIANNSLVFAKRLLRNAINGGNSSLTILSLAQFDNNNSVDGFIFDEIKEVCNMTLQFSKELLDNDVYPTIDIKNSYTYKDDFLQTQQEINLAKILRRYNSKGIENKANILNMFENNASDESFIELTNK